MTPVDLSEKPAYLQKLCWGRVQFGLSVLSEMVGKLLFLIMSYLLFNSCGINLSGSDMNELHEKDAY